MAFRNLGNCTWTQSADDNSFWSTKCGNEEHFNGLRPSDSLMAYCHYCGGVLVEIEAGDENPDPPAKDESDDGRSTRHYPSLEGEGE